MKITTLMDNVAYGRGIRAEHGLSVLIETGGSKILFDTGQSDAFLSNATVLGVDLASVDAVVLSHGHYDHTGGLEAFFRINPNAKAYCKPAALKPKFRGERGIGIPTGAAALQSRFALVQEAKEIAAGVTIVPDIPIRNEWDGHWAGFSVHGSEGFEPDPFEDELFLMIAVDEGTIIVTGCSHRGVTNIVRAAKDHSPERIRLVLGGFHVKDDKPEAIARMAAELELLEVERMGVGHCTGVDGYAVIKRLRPEATFYNHAGNIVEF